MIHEDGASREVDCIIDDILLSQKLVNKAYFEQGRTDIPCYTTKIDDAMLMIPDHLIICRYFPSRFVRHQVEISEGVGKGGWIGSSDVSFALSIVDSVIEYYSSLEM